MAKPNDHPPVAHGKIGLLLVNLGTPDAPDAPAVRRYLAEFLSDPRVVEIPALLWKPILHGIILRTRPRKSAHAYAQVWTEAGSPLAANTRAIAEGLAARFGDVIHVDFAMRYGTPAIDDRIARMRALGCDRILFAPLYPQYCSATTGTAFDALSRTLTSMRWQPAIRTLPPYHDDPAYIGVLVRTIEADLAALPFIPDLILASFHGMPQRTLTLGDPYHCQCQKTARLLQEALDQPMRIAFQSRFGRAKWLEPSTEAVLRGLPGEGIKKVAIVAPGFAADCLETLEELDIRGRNVFAEAGGTHFAYLPCLNARGEALTMFEAILRRELAGWIGDD